MKTARYPSLMTIVSILFFTLQATGQVSSDNQLPVRGFCIAAPRPADVNRFVTFINDELVPRNVNTLILRVDYNFEYTSHPELRSGNPLSEKDVNKLVRACDKHNIRLIPQVNLLGHQSWHSTPSKLLEVYPEFDETPHIPLPETYEWPNEHGLYCKSYCPLHPEVHEVVFAIVDEICTAFQADAFHAGMDEVFYIGDDKCPRCSGKDKSALFAGEVSKIRDHLYADGRELWIWGDRLIDRYHLDPKIPLPFISLGSQKNFIAIYHMGMYTNQELEHWFVAEYPKHSKTKLDMGKSCIRLKNPDAIPYDLIAELVKKMTVNEWISAYEKSKPDR
ncbi:MAG: family 20 glycosylhydrolase [Bacteroidales bacterium]|nr:family 20 glycosylhydrolase [Bacteroidales bacterium]MDT8431480.1 family 20 glycosylhydrolase [Bacteroidales bacterium]